MWLPASSLTALGISWQSNLRQWRRRRRRRHYRECDSCRVLSITSITTIGLSVVLVVCVTTIVSMRLIYGPGAYFSSIRNDKKETFALHSFDKDPNAKSHHHHDSTIIPTAKRQERHEQQQGDNSFLLRAAKQVSRAATTAIMTTTHHQPHYHPRVVKVTQELEPPDTLPVVLLLALSNKDINLQSIPMTILPQHTNNSSSSSSNEYHYSFTFTSAVPLADPAEAAFSFHNHTSKKARAVAPLGNQAFLLTHLRSDKFYLPPLPMETPQCKAQHAWQLSSPAFLSVCNTVHEQCFASLGGGGGGGGGSTQATTPTVVKRIASGTWRDVWTLEDYRASGTGHGMSNTSNNTSTGDTVVILKTLKLETQYWTPNIFHDQWKDALIMERLTAEPMVLDIYGFCGNSGLFEYAPNGDLERNLCLEMDPANDTCLVPARRTPLERLQMGVQVAMGVAALHNFDQEGRASIAHCDLDAQQFVKKGNIFKLNDFNLAQLLAVERHDDSSVCPVFRGSYTRKGPPEQFSVSPAETEKSDVYSMGNVLYQILTSHRVYEGLERDDALSQLEHGQVPNLPPLEPPNDPSLVALQTAVEMCRVLDPRKRASAREVEVYLKKRLEEIDPGRVETWIGAKPRT